MEKKSNKVSDFVTIFRKVKPLFEPRRNYAWECPLENVVEGITDVYAYQGNLYVLCDESDCELSDFPIEVRNKVVEEAIKWLKKQPQTQSIDYGL